jgi:hypothetical protein
VPPPGGRFGEGSYCRARAGTDSVCWRIIIFIIIIIIVVIVIITRQ